MGYKTKYTSNVTDHSGTTFVVNLLKNGYTSTASTITHYSPNPLILDYRGDRNDTPGSVRGSEVTFNIYVKEADNNKYDEIVESNYKDWMLEIKNKAKSTSFANSTFTEDSYGHAWTAKTINTVIIPPVTTTTTTTAPPTTTTTTTTMPPPSEIVVSYSTGTWHGTLSYAVGINVVINNLTANGYSSAVCGGGAEESDFISNLTITAGSTSANQTHGGLTCDSASLIISNTATINGVSRSDGEVWTESMQRLTLTVLQRSCSTYSC